MHRRILIFSTVAFLMLSTANTVASPMLMDMGVAEQIEQERLVSISIEGNRVQIQGASGMTLEVVSLTGRHVASFKIDSSSQRIELNIPKGCYILKVGKVVRKVTVR
jgi:hypothetical protein